MGTRLGVAIRRMEKVKSEEEVRSQVEGILQAVAGYRLVGNRLNAAAGIGVVSTLLWVLGEMPYDTLLEGCDPESGAKVQAILLPRIEMYERLLRSQS